MSWRPVVGWEGFYEVSENGKVRSVERVILCRDGKQQRRPSRELTWRKNLNGYQCVHLRDSGGGRRRVAMVHRLVAEAFVPNPHKKPTVNHLDNDRSNPKASNLEWCTQLENLQHAARQGRLQKDYWRGKRSPNAAVSDEVVRDIRRRYARGVESWETIGRSIGLSKRAVGRIVRRETYADVC